MVEPLRHRQTKEAETDMFSLQPPRHIPTLLFSDLNAVARSAVERLRIEVARQRVQSSSEAIERVAQVTGFRDPERMRRAFIRAFGQPPQSLRRAARAGEGVNASIQGRRRTSAMS